MKLLLSKNKEIPEFVIDYGDQDFSGIKLLPSNCDTTAWYMAFNYDKTVMDYRLLCKYRSDGNPDYGYPEGGYQSGWSSRSSAINKDEGYCYVDMYPYAIELDKLLYLVLDNYDGDVFISVNEDSHDIEYIVRPYIESMDLSYDHTKTFWIMNTKDDAFVEVAMHRLCGGPDLYVWPDGDVAYDIPLDHKSDDYAFYPAK